MVAAALEELEGDRALIIRYYSDDIEPVSPNPFRSPITIDCHGPFGWAKAAYDIKFTNEMLTVAADLVRPKGIKVLYWEHKQRPYAHIV